MRSGHRKQTRALLTGSELVLVVVEGLVYQMVFGLAGLGQVVRDQLCEDWVRSLLRKLL